MSETYNTTNSAYPNNNGDNAGGNPPLPPGSDGQQISLVEEMRKSFLDYAMSVIVSRALPDVRDGLKPVHRRILYHMKDKGYTHQKSFSKSARIVGEVMGRFHPHGDGAIYSTLVRMAQTFSLRLPLIQGQGNFGSIDDDPPAAMRYTEARLAKSAEAMLADIDFDTVPFAPNYDESEQEPEYLPSRLPNLLINGTEGIAVGMATSIPTHNVTEVVNAALTLLANPDAELGELMQHLPGPDFPTAGIIFRNANLVQAYRTGKGSFSMRGRIEVEELGGKRIGIVIKEIPYQVSKVKLIEQILDRIRNKSIEGIMDIRDLSNRQGIRVVIELKRGVDAQQTIQKLYKHTSLQMSYGITMLALYNNRPHVMSLREILQHFLDFREQVITRRLHYELARKRKRAHEVLGLLVAIHNIDALIGLIKQSESVAAARAGLLARQWPLPTMDAVRKLILLSELPEVDTAEQTSYQLSEHQARSILELSLQRLTGLERAKLASEADDLIERIAEIISILDSQEKLRNIIREELKQIAKDFATPRLTQIEAGEATIQSTEELVEREEMVVVISKDMQIKRVPLTTYNTQKRGGKGAFGMNIREDDVIKHLLVGNTHDGLIFFSNDGFAFASKIYSLPLGNRRSPGRSLYNFLKLNDKQRISAILKTSSESESSDTELIFSTSRGNLRRNSIRDFNRINAGGKTAMRMELGETLVNVAQAHINDDVLVASRNGFCVRCAVAGLRQFSGRSSRGVRGVKLQTSDEVVSMSILPCSSEEAMREQYLIGSGLRRRDRNELSLEQRKQLQEWEQDPNMQAMRDAEVFILTVTTRGYGKLTSSYEYRRINRGAQGYANIILSEKIGVVLTSFPVTLQQQLLMVTSDAVTLRCKVSDIRPTMRRTQGVKLLDIPEGVTVVSVAPIIDESEDVE